MPKQKGMNKYQKAAFRPGEHRTRRHEIEEMLELAQNADPVERAIAAQNLCPCHVRRRIDEVWQALYRMMEDPDVRVRRAAWHTLEDGGSPNDPAFQPILTRALTHETDSQVRRFVELFAASARARRNKWRWPAPLPRAFPCVAAVISVVRRICPCAAILRQRSVLWVNCSAMPIFVRDVSKLTII